MTGSELKNMLDRSPTDCHRALIREYGRYVYAIVFNKLRSCGTQEDIEECVSDVFADIFIKFEYEEAYVGDIKGYIGTVAKRTAIDRFRSLSAANSHVVYEDEDDMQQLVSDFSVDERVDSSELRRVLLNKIAELGEPDSTIIIQKFYYNRTSSEIARNVSMNPSSVRSRCTRAVQKLRGKTIQKIAFTALAIAKYNNVLHETNDGWVNITPSDLFTLANASASSVQKTKMLRDLMLGGLIKMSNKVDSTNFRVLFLSTGNNDDLIVYDITDLRNLGYAYEEAFGGKFDRCEVCGRLIRRLKRKRHYCNDCITKYGYKDTGRVRKPAGVYIVSCVDCGHSFLVDGKAFGKKVRCDECQHKRDLELTRERMRRVREENSCYADNLQ